MRVPLIQRLLDELRRRATQLGTSLLQISHRALADVLGCSASMLPRLMRQLENDGHIARSSYKNGYMVEVIDHSGDRSLGVIDHLSDRSEVAQQDAPNPAAAADQQNSAYKEDSRIHDQEEESCVAPLFFAGDQQLLTYLKNHPDGKANGRKLDIGLAWRIAQSGIGTITDFELDLAEARIQGKDNPFYFVIACWRNGRRYAPQEASDVRPDRPTHRPAGRPSGRGSGAGSTRRPASQRGSGTQQRRESPPTRAERLEHQQQRINDRNRRANVSDSLDACSN